MDLIIAHKKAFSLRDEIGQCPNIKVNIEVNDPSTFFVRPFSIAEEDKSPHGQVYAETSGFRNIVQEQNDPYFPSYVGLLGKEVKGKGQW